MRQLTVAISDLKIALAASKLSVWKMHSLA